MYLKLHCLISFFLSVALLSPLRRRARSPPQRLQQPLRRRRQPILHRPLPAPTGTLRGHISDPSGALIPGTQVTDHDRIRQKRWPMPPPMRQAAIRCADCPRELYHPSRPMKALRPSCLHRSFGRRSGQERRHQDGHRGRAAAGGGQRRRRPDRQYGSRRQRQRASSSKAQTSMRCRTILTSYRMS